MPPVCLYVTIPSVPKSWFVSEFLGLTLYDLQAIRIFNDEFVLVPSVFSYAMSSSHLVDVLTKCRSCCEISAFLSSRNYNVKPTTLIVV